MDNLTAGNPRAHAIRVYYNDTDTIYEGMPVCYNYDTDTNWFGGSVSDGAVSATTTTADGSQNERRYIEVESPSDNNLSSFAGVVKRGGWCGKSGARVLDIYVPNGAIVPVRCDVDTTKGVTILAITVDSQELGQPVSGTSRCVAIAAEDETGLDGTTDITLATLDPNRFLYQNLDGTAFNVGVGTSNLVVNEINITTAQTGGDCTAFVVKHALTGTIPTATQHSAASVMGYLACSGEYSGATDSVIYARAIMGYVNLAGGTFDSDSANFYGVLANIAGAPTTFTEVGRIFGVCSDVSLATSPTTGNYSTAGLINNGLATLDQFIYCYGNRAVQPGKGGCKYLMKIDICHAAADEMNACVITGGAGDTTIDTGGNWAKIRIDIDGTQYWLVAMTDPSET